MAAPHYAIVGGGTAGVRAADVLRNEEPKARLTVISAEPTHYLRRHRLARFVVEDKPLEALNMHKPEWYEERDIRLRLNQPVVAVDVDKKYITLAHRERVGYDKLLICSGSRRRVPEYLSRFSKLLTHFENGVHAIKLKERIGRLEHLTMLGGDCVALQLCWALRKAGKKISLVMDDYRFWPLEFDNEIKDRLAAALMRKGFEVVKDDYVIDIQGEGDGLTIETRGGARIETNAAVLSSGMTPNVEFLARSPIDVQEGVLVNEFLEANVSDVYAAGECAQIYFKELNAYRCSTGFVNASNQGKLAARNMLGAREEVTLGEPGQVVIEGEKFITYGWKGFSLDETG